MIENILKNYELTDTVGGTVDVTYFNLYLSKSDYNKMYLNFASFISMIEKLNEYYDNYSLITKEMTETVETIKSFEDIVETHFSYFSWKHKHYNFHGRKIEFEIMDIDNIIVVNDETQSYFVYIIT